jgi:hypothetical protein
MNLALNNNRRTLRVALGMCALAGLLVNAGAQTTALVSRASGLSGALGNGDSPLVGAKISGNGQFVVFRSAASNLVAGDTNGKADVFVRDTTTHATTRVSVGPLGLQAVGGDSNNPCISADGRFIAFSSTATNLVSGGTSGSHVFLHDRQTGITTLVSVGSDGVTPGNAASDSPSIWSNGASSVKVAFRSSAGNLINGGTTGSQVFVRETDFNLTSLVSAVDGGTAQGNGDSGWVQTAISGDGSTVGFTSGASNLVASDTNGNVNDVFTRNLTTNATTLISQTTTGLQGLGSSNSCALSTDGSIVAFQSYNGLVNGDTNNVGDVFVRDTNTSTTTRVSIATGANGAQGNGASGNSNGWGIAISGDGSRVLFQSLAKNLTSKDTNNFEGIFLRNRTTNSTVMVSVTPANKLANGSSGGLNTCGVSMSANGQFMMFASYASNLVSGDTNGKMDVFRRGPY